MHELDKTLEGPALNTDREIWRERPGDYYADSIHVTASGGIGIDCGGMVYTLPVREWHRLASSTSAGVTEEQTGTFAGGLKAAVKFVRKRLDDYVAEHGMYDPETGATEFPGNGDETVCEWEEIIEGLEALKEIKP